MGRVLLSKLPLIWMLHMEKNFFQNLPTHLSVYNRWSIYYQIIISITKVVLIIFVCGFVIREYLQASLTIIDFYQLFTCCRYKLPKKKAYLIQNISILFIHLLSFPFDRESDSNSVINETDRYHLKRHPLKKN